MTRQGGRPVGRGRAKAKQTKVARDLKYRTFSTDFSSLERELRGERGELLVETEDEDEELDEYDDPYADDDDDDEGDTYPGRNAV